MNNSRSSIRVGTDAGFSDDRSEPAVGLAERGSVTVSLAQDMHGKSLSYLMLAIELPGDEF
jgi:hypothetical protein